MEDDVDVIESILAGDVDSFGTLVRRYEGPLFRLIRNLIPDAVECEDIAQDAFLSAYANLPSYDPRRSLFSTWLFTIARNRCINVLKRRRAVVVDPLPEPMDARTPLDCAAEKETFRRLDAALHALPIEQKTAFVLSEIQGLSYQEICKIERVRLGTVKSRISRAKQKLRGVFLKVAESR